MKNWKRVLRCNLQGGFAPLTVKWADTNFNEKKRRAAEELADPNRDNNQVRDLKQTLFSTTPSYHRKHRDRQTYFYYRKMATSKLLRVSV